MGIAIFPYNIMNIIVNTLIGFAFTALALYAYTAYLLFGGLNV